ncbi:hypothetical protein NEOLEDRAFT_1020936, partial [Neolentinus lepideus HHB14362 ss-1]
FYLRGIIYHGDYHFTCRYVDKIGDIWFNDGMETGRACFKEGNIQNTPLQDLMSCRGKSIATVIYAQ